jgi:hypothetical protein
MNTTSNQYMTLDMLYHPQLTKIYDCYQATVFLISSCIFIPSIYVILIKSTHEMSVYKLLLVDQIIFSYLSDLCQFLWQPILLYPFFMAYSAGITKNLGPTSVYLMYCLIFFFMTGLIHATFFSMIYRVSMIYDEWKISKVFENGWELVKFGVVTFILLEVVVFSKF